MMNITKQWFIYSFVGVVLGLALGFVVAWLWFFISLVFFRHGDSAPSWVNTVNDFLFYGGVLVGIVGGQLLFAFRDRVISFVAKFGKRKQNS